MIPRPRGQHAQVLIEEFVVLSAELKSTSARKRRILRRIQALRKILSGHLPGRGEARYYRLELQQAQNDYQSAKTDVIVLLERLSVLPQVAGEFSKPEGSVLQGSAHDLETRSSKNNGADPLDATKNYYRFRDAGRFGSHPLHDGYGDESDPD
jgi:hypothetical protein